MDWIKANPVMAASLGIGGGLLAKNALSPQKLPNQDKLDALAQQAEAMSAQNSDLSKRLLDPLATGKLPAPQEAQVQQALQDSITAIKSKYASLGMSGSTVEQDDIQAANQKALVLSGTLAEQMAQTGLSAGSQAASSLQISGTIYETIMQQQIQQDNALQQAIAAFAGQSADGGRYFDIWQSEGGLMPDPQTDTGDDPQKFLDQYKPPAPSAPSGGGIDEIVAQTQKEMPSVNEMIDYDKRVSTAKADAMEKGIATQKQGVAQLQQMQAPKPPPKPNLPQAPQQQMRDMFQAFQNPAVVLAGLASLATRAPLTAAFKAGAAALEGFHKGDQEAIKNNVENWRNETDRALAQSKIELEAYKETWEKYKDDKTKLIAELQAQASISKDEVILAEVRSRAQIRSGFSGCIRSGMKSMAELEKAKAQIQMYLGRSMTMLHAGSNAGHGQDTCRNRHYPRRPVTVWPAGSRRDIQCGNAVWRGRPADC